MRTGIAAKPVKGSWLVLAAAASWRSGCVWDSSAGRTPPGWADGVLVGGGVLLPVPLLGGSDSAGRTPPSSQTVPPVLPFCSAPPTVPPPPVVVVGVGVGVHSAYWATEALLPFPVSARPAPAVLNSIPVTSIARMAKRDFMDWLLREGSAARRRTRCLIASSSRSVTCGRSASRR